MKFSCIPLLLFTLLIISCNGQNSVTGKIPVQALADPGDPASIHQGPSRDNPLVLPWEALRNNQDLYHIQNRPAASEMQVSQYIRRIFEDRDGNIWFGTNDDGVCLYKDASFTYFTVKEGLAGNTVRGIVQDEEGILWLATNGGLSRIDLTKTRTKENFITNYTVKNGLPDNEIWSLFRDSRGTIWAGTMAGVCHFSPAGITGLQFIKTELPPVTAISTPRFTASLVWSFGEDKSGNIWMGTDGAGVCKLNGQTQAITRYTKADGLNDNNITSILCAGDGTIWMGTKDNGVNHFADNRFRSYTVKDGLCGNFIWTMLEDANGQLWLGSAGGGVSCFDGKTFSTYTENSGLTRNHVQSIMEDRRGDLWFGFSGGVFRLVKEKEERKVLRNFIKPGC